MNTLATLKNLHKKFPHLSLDDLIAILNCYVEKTIIYNPYNTKIWYSNSDTITANSN